MFNIALVFGQISQTLTEYSFSGLIGPLHNPLNITWLLGQISWTLTEYSLGVLVDLADSTFNINRLFIQISWTLTEYSLNVVIGPPDAISNIVFVMLSDYLDTGCIFTMCMARLYLTFRRLGDDELQVY